jgi:hypothetical protein
MCSLRSVLHLTPRTNGAWHGKWGQFHQRALRQPAALLLRQFVCPQHVPFPFF